MSRPDLEESSAPWRALVKGIAELNALLQQNLSSPGADETTFFDEALGRLSDLIPGENSLAIRLIDASKRELYLAFVRGRTPLSVADLDRLPYRFDIEERPPKSLGALVVQTREAHVISGIDDMPLPYEPAFPHFQRMIVAPIWAADEVIGVLDISGSDAAPFPQYAGAFAEVFGQQLGLYIHATRTVRQQRAAREELSRMTQDFTHQIRTPLLLLQRDANHLVERTSESLGADAPFDQRLLLLRSLASRARLAGSSLELFGKLHRGEALPLNKAQMDSDTLLAECTELAQDQLVVSNPSQRLRFVVDKASFASLGRLSFDVDRSLLVQALGNLLDNAMKYSFRETKVVLSCTSRDGKGFYVSVCSTGLALTPEQALASIQRGWRSEDASSVTAEGSGIGLWVVDHIMRAHGGHLEVLPTDSRGRTTVTLGFPTE